MAVLVSLSIVTFLFGIFIFVRGQHAMHQIIALIFFLLSALFLAGALLAKEIRGFFARRRSPAPDAVAGPEPPSDPQPGG